MVNAKTALEKVATATTISQRVMSWFTPAPLSHMAHCFMLLLCFFLVLSPSPLWVSRFRSSTDLTELKGHQEKLKTLCPILSLAITTSQQNKNKVPP
jgi:hypothetical protein